MTDSSVPRTSNESVKPGAWLLTGIEELAEYFARGLHEVHAGGRVGAGGCPAVPLVEIAGGVQGGDFPAHHVE